MVDQAINTMNAKEWFDKGTYHSVEGNKIFVIDTGNENQSSEEVNQSEKPLLCILHGFPTSSYDYWKVLTKLSENYRVIVHDHLGFGYSDKPKDYSYSFIDQTDIALSLWQQLGIKNTSIIAHDYGTSLLTEILARDNKGYCLISIERIILCNGSMHIELAKLRLMQKLLRSNLVGNFIAQNTNKRILKKNLKNIYVDPSKINDEEIDAIWQMMNFNNGKDVLAEISRYTFERKNLWHRWIGALQNTQLPIEIVWPDKDPIAVAEMATVIKNETKNSRLYWLDDLGHFPMLEDPTQWCSKVLKGLTEAY